jgi:4-hydroxy-tetrahydrodipicolinate synthase
MRSINLHGSIVALVTPFANNGAVDYAAFDALVAWHLASGTHGLVVGGTTGEASALSEAEFLALVARAKRQIGDSIPLLAGTGAQSTAETIARTQAAAAVGADAALVVTPSYVRPPQRGLAAHFLAVADASSIPLVLYNVPTRTAVDLLPSTVRELSAHANIIAIKEAKPDLDRISELVRDTSLTVLSGDDPTCLAAMDRGAKGVISVVANLIPAVFAAILADPQAEAQRAAFARLEVLLDGLGVEPNPLPVKALLATTGRIGPAHRLPLLPLDAALLPALTTLFVDAVAASGTPTF